MASVELISQAEYARRRAVDPTTVRDAIRAGRITTIAGPDGKPMIDPAVADIQWQRNTRARVRAAPRHQMHLDDGAPIPPAQPDVQDGAGIGNTGDGDYWASRARREAAEAEMAELKLAEQHGTLIRLDAVRTALASVIASTRDSLLQLPARLAPVLAAETSAARVHDIIQAEIHQALAQLTAAPARLADKDAAS